MTRKNFYDDDTYRSLLERLAGLDSDTQPEWGRMNAAQMCAHCTEVAEVAHGKALTGTPWYVRLLGGLVKRLVLSDRPYPKSTKTHPQYLIAPDVDFEREKARLLGILEEMHSAGREHAGTTRHPIFGEMTADEHGWATYKHLDHHLQQFGL